MFGLNPLLLAGVSVVALGAAWWTGHEMAGDARDAKLGKNFAQRLAVEREVGVRREVNLWTQIGDERKARLEMINTFQKIDQVSAEARAKMVAAMQREKASSEAALQEAARNIQELKDAASQMAKDWKGGVIPPDITCGVFDGKGCSAPAYPATGADPDHSVDVRDGAAGKDGGS